MIKINGKDVKLTLNMICGNEFPERLKDALLSVQGIADEIIVGYNGNNEATEKILKDFKVNYFKQVWTGKFDEMRTQVLEKSSEGLIMWIDTDDIIINPENILPSIEKGFNIPGVGMLWTDYHYEHNKQGECIKIHPRERVFYKNCGHWVGGLHECFLQTQDVSHYNVDSWYIRHMKDPKEFAATGIRNLKIIEKIYFEEKKDNNLDPRTVFDYGRSLAGLGMSEDCIRILTEYMPLSGSDQDRAIAYLIMSDAHLLKGRLGMALDCAVQVTRLQPTWPDGYLQEAYIYFKISRYPEAITLINMALPLNPPYGQKAVNPLDYSIKPLKHLAFSYLNTMEFEKCLDVCNKFIKISKMESKDMLMLKEECEKIMKTERLTKALMEVKKDLEAEKNESKLKKFANSLPNDLYDYPAFIRMRLEHGKQKKNRIVIYCGDSIEYWNPLSVKTGVGGSEEAVIYLSSALAKEGWAVDVYCKCGDPANYDGVMWHNWFEWNPDIEKCDIFICWRGPQLCALAPKHCKQVYLWCHDVMKMLQFPMEWNKKIDKIFLLSKYHKINLEEIPDKKIIYTKNGIVPSQFVPIKEKRSEHRFIYASSPDRGLPYLLDIWPKIREKWGDAMLHVFYGFTKTFEAIRSTDRNWVQLKDKILKQLSDLQPQGVINHSMVSHRDIAEMFQICGYWLYPTQFTEISCITAMKAQAGGCWPITTDIGALPETVKFGAVLKGIDTYTEEGKQKYLELVLNTVGTITDTQRKEMSDWAIKNFDWANVARQWSDMFISERRRK